MSHIATIATIIAIKLVILPHSYYILLMMLLLILFVMDTVVVMVYFLSWFINGHHNHT